VIPTSRLLPFVAAVLAALGWAGRAEAQLQVSLQLNRNQFVAYEPILATVTVSNRAGKDVVLGEVNGRSWLTFNVDEIGGNPILAVDGAPRPQPRVLAAGQSTRETISLGKYFPLGGLGNYSVRANVYFPEFGQFMISNVRSFAVTDGTPLWRDQFGVKGPGKSTSYRKVSLLSFQDDDKMDLYVRIRDETQQRVIATYSIGRLVLQRDPQAVLDSESRINVLFLTGPRMFRHVVVDHDGMKVSDDLYEVKGASFPEMRITDQGRVRVVGGQFYDPQAPPPPQELVHRLTDRPPGVPDETVDATPDLRRR
jgi:hypothetical protein